MKTGYTHITIVLDRSGSMRSIASDTIGGFNRFIADQQALPGECTLAMIQFDSEGIDTLYNGVPIKAAKPLTNETFVPRGGTPLYDAIGRTINTTGQLLKDMPHDQRPANVIFVIITDGLENASREFTREKVLGMIKHQREAYQWEFVYLGANQDAMAVGHSIGVSSANSMSYAANHAGTCAAYHAVSSNVLRMRSGTADSMCFSDKQRTEQDEAEKK